MSKRRLSKQQQSRITEKQKLVSESQAADGTLSQNKCNGRVISHFGQQLDVEPFAAAQDETTADTLTEAIEPASSRGIIRCHQRANLPALVTGDLVVWEQEASGLGVIVAQGERRNVFARPDAAGRLKAVAANIDVVLVVIAVAPEPFMNLIDRYLVAIETMGLKAALVLNKTDLLNQKNTANIDNMLSIYEELGYQSFRVSSVDGSGIEALQSFLEHQTTALVGQSGVGKSSLINKFGGSQLAEVGGLSKGKEKGTHTTTTARLFHLGKIDLIDSPGIREFSLGHIDQADLIGGFVELRDLAGLCKFRNCMHQSEPGCAILSAVEEYRINPQRLQSYFQILQSMNNS